MNLFKILTLSILSLALVSCHNNDIKEKIKNDEPILFENDDQAMNKAITTAIQSFSTFQESFMKRQEGFENFAIKVRFDTQDGGGEHLWIGDLEKVGDGYRGIVNNKPQSTQEVQLGDTITVDKNRISDWMYSDKGILKGGYTIRIMRDQLSEQERKAFDEETGFIIED